MLIPDYEGKRLNACPCQLVLYFFVIVSVSVVAYSYIQLCPFFNLGTVNWKNLSFPEYNKEIQLHAILASREDR